MPGTDDAERDWPPVRAAERCRMSVYARFQAEIGGGVSAGGVRGNTEAERIPQTSVVGDVGHCPAELRSFIRDYGITQLVSGAVPPGMRPEPMNGSLERFFRDGVPRLG